MRDFAIVKDTVGFVWAIYLYLCLISASVVVSVSEASDISLYSSDSSHAQHLSLHLLWPQHFWLFYTSWYGCIVCVFVCVGYGLCY